MRRSITIFYLILVKNDVLFFAKNAKTNIQAVEERLEIHN
jgi:hypothetical protein